MEDLWNSLGSRAGVQKALCPLQQACSLEVSGLSRTWCGARVTKGAETQLSSQLDRSSEERDLEAATCPDGQSGVSPARAQSFLWPGGRTPGGLQENLVRFAF